MAAGTVTVTDSLVAGGYVTGTNILDADPQFVDADGADAITGTLDDNLQLRRSSPAINRGANQWLQGVATDLAGQPRVVGGVVDLGAYERQDVPPPGTPLYVSQAARGANTGLSLTNAYTDVQLALTSVISGTPTEIWVARGTYTPGPATVYDRARQTFLVPRGAALYGGFAATETLRLQRNIVANPTILSGDLAGDDQPVPNQFRNRSDNVMRLVTMRGADQTTVLDGFTLANSGNSYANTTEIMAALRLEQSSPQLANLHLTRSFIGVAAFQSTVRLRDSELDDNNSADYGPFIPINPVPGAGIDLEASIGELTGLLIHDNVAMRGGGVGLRAGSTAHITDTLIRNNKSYSCGGGIAVVSSVLHLSNSSI